MRQLGDVVGNLFPADQLPKTPAPKAKRKRAAEPKNQKLAKAATEILRRPDREERGYLSREFVQCSLPYRDPGKIEAWVRRNGNSTLIIEPGFNEETMSSYGLPFGENAKLLSIWTETEAVRIKNAGKYEVGQPVALLFGPSFRSFLIACGCNVDTGRGKRGAFALMQEQMFRFFNAKISFVTAEGDKVKGSKERDQMLVARKVHYWWDYRNADQDSLFESKVLLTWDFFNAITENPVPLDLRAIIALKNSISQSSFALDLYIWATHRLHRMGQSGQTEISVPLAALQEQFGSHYSRLLDFKKALIKTLAQVQLVIPSMAYSFNKNTLILRRIKAVGHQPTTESPGTGGVVPSNDLVGEEAIEAFRREFPGWDVYTAIAEFYEWRADKGQKSADTNKHFMGFARTWVKNNQ